jgi:hypothetical protein
MEHLDERLMVSWLNYHDHLKVVYNNAMSYD